MRGRLRRSLRIARVETRRHNRRQREHAWRAFGELFLVVFAALVVIGEVPLEAGSPYPDPGAYYYGRQLAAGNVEAAAAAARGFAGILFVLVALVTILWTLKGQGWREQSDGLLTTVSVGTIVAGDALAKAAKATRFLSLAVLGGGVAFAAGSGSVLAGVAVVAGALALVATAVACGYVCGLAGLLLLRRSAFAREHRLVVGSPLAAVYFALVVGSRRAGALLGPTPLGWYADPALAAVGGDVDPTYGLVALAAGPVAAVGLWPVAAGLARRAWTVDPPGDGREPLDEGDERERAAPAATRLLDRTLAACCSRPTRTVVRAVWRRVLRVPQALLYVALPVSLLLSVGYELARAVPAATPVLVAAYGAGAAGAGATLNPLGNEGNGLPAALTAPGGARHLVRGYVVSAALPGAPIVAAVAVAAASILTRNPLALVGTAAFAAGLTVAFVAVSVGVGTRLPEFDGIRPAGNAGVTTPHLYAVLAYSVVLALLSVPALGALYLGAAGGGGAAGLSTGALAALGGACTLALSGIVGALCYRSAVRTFEEYRIGE